MQTILFYLNDSPGAEVHAYFATTVNSNRAPGGVRTRVHNLVLESLFTTFDASISITLLCNNAFVIIVMNLIFIFADISKSNAANRIQSFRSINNRITRFVYDSKTILRGDYSLNCVMFISA